MYNYDKADLKSPTYTPNRLLNKAAEFFGVETDAELARVLEFHQAILTRTRNRKAPVNSFLMVRIMDRTNWTIQYVRELAGMPYDGGTLEGMFRRFRKKKRIPGPPINEPKITDAQVLEIHVTKGPAKETAEKYGITPGYVRHIRAGTCRRVARLVQSCCEPAREAA